jgi:ribosomal protein S1
VANQSKSATSMAELMARDDHFQTLKKGQIIEGTIKKLTPQEILLDIGAKSDALVIEYDRQNLENLLNLLKVGDKVSASVISAESEEGFPVVSLRKTLDDKIFSQFEGEFKENKSISVQVVDTTRGGYFVESGRGLRGFLPNSQIMPELRDQEGQLVGKSIDVKIIEFDRSRRRMIFSQKATVYLTDSAEIAKLTPKGSTVEGVVTSITPYGLYITVSPNKDTQIEGFVHISELSHDRVSDINALYKVGDKLTGQVKDIDGENRRLTVSVKNLAADSFDSIKEKYPLESKVTGVVQDVKSRGVTLSLEEGISGFIPANKIPAGTTYTKDENVSAEVSDYDIKRRLVIVSPVLKAKFVGYR